MLPEQREPVCAQCQGNTFAGVPGSGEPAWFCPRHPEAGVLEVVYCEHCEGRGWKEIGVVTTPHDDPIVAACVEHGGHFWPADAPEDEPATCTRCWFNPGWAKGKPRNEAELRPVIDDPRA